MTNTSNADYAALLLRLSLGVLFIAHGALKLFVFTPAGTVGFFGSLGLPAIFAYLTILAEIGGGAALIAGFATRLVSIATLPILLGAIFLVHGANGWLYSNPNGGWEFPAFWAVALIVQALLGDGAYAVKTPRLLALTPASASE
ncbi:DoxX family protein [Nisaea acidiphila]|uniref:DoxX family protein n=1 Tax=Nisaea acidiphila TaxID=1862145 RepID=A0A9J7AN36_9PROT|nr:DoxX family protein [Nisaea acidiphila]UUX48856.1 DoxX family protein [Nisaea acidiphila]